MEDIRLFTTLAHEGYPGHLYQTTYYANTNPDPLRNLLNFSGYVEGWATYAEMCSYYLSSLEKPYATLLQKTALSSSGFMRLPTSVFTTTIGVLRRPLSFYFLRNQR